MSPRRYQAYLKLANALLDCQPGHEQAVLASHPELLDQGLEQTLRQLVRERRQRGDQVEVERLEDLLNYLKLHPAYAPGRSTPLAPATAPLVQAADRLFRQGSECYQASQFHTARQIWQQALTLYQEVGDPQGEAHTLDSLSVACQSLGQYETALQRAHQALALRRESCLGPQGDRPRSRVGQEARLERPLLPPSHHSQGEYSLAVKLAIDHFQKQLALTEAVGDRLSAANTWMHLGQAYFSLGQYTQAQAAYQQALALQVAFGDPPSQARSLLGLAEACEALAQDEAALAYYHQYLDLLHHTHLASSPPPTSLAAALTRRARLYDRLGNDERALQDYREALAIAQAQEDDYYAAIAWSGLGNTHYSLGNATEALTAYEHALDLKSELGDRFGAAIQLQNLSQVYRVLGDSWRAHQLQSHALILKRTLSSLNEPG